MLYPNFWNKRTIPSYLLWPLSQIYKFASIIRFSAQNPIKLPSKVVCVGNLTVGGTGKTQMVIWLARKLQQENVRFVIISKGYKSNIKAPVIVNTDHNAIDVGDEALMLSQFGTVISAKRVVDAYDLLSGLNPSVIIVDDGLQNNSFYKDFTIITYDSMRGFGNGFLLPAGPLRQDIHTGLQNVDCVVMVNKGVNKGVNINLKNQHVIDVINAIVVPQFDIRAENQYFAFCGIGNPESFFELLRSSGYYLVGTKIFRDHHHYSESDVRNLQMVAQKFDARLITTTKDYVKLKNVLDAENFSVSLVLENEEVLMNKLKEKSIL